MLRITVESKAGSSGFRLEGKLTGEWVRELERCWISSRESNHQARLRIDLGGVSFVDGKGKALLETMVAEGAELVAHTPLMASMARTIVENVRRAACDPTRQSAEPAHGRL